ncbi:hypothetical protein BGW80DRAFT_1394036 [Lactifluus volemus]|nr:hypothetical protein BGW80DRAFT_1394036 [Lactifluus volemus]
MGFNEFPGLPGPGHAPPEELARYRAHCFPEIDQIVSRVRDVRASFLSMTTLRRVCVLTGGPSGFKS